VEVGACPVSLSPANVRLRLTRRPSAMSARPRRPRLWCLGVWAPARADACWRPIASGLTPHGLRHSHKTLMDELARAAEAHG
jgi:integrase